MAKSRKKPTEENDSTQPDTAQPAPTFEEALAELQQIVNELEEGALGLEDSLGRFDCSNAPRTGSHRGHTRNIARKIGGVPEYFCAIRVNQLTMNNEQ